MISISLSSVILVVVFFIELAAVYSGTVLVKGTWNAALKLGKQHK